MGINCLPVLEVFTVVSRSVYSEHIHVALGLAQGKRTNRSLPLCYFRNKENKTIPSKWRNSLAFCDTRRGS